MYDHLFIKPNADDVEDGVDFKANLNPDSLKVLTACRVESGLAGAAPGSRFQFLRQGYFCVDDGTTSEKLIFNRTVSLRDTWAKIRKAQKS